MDLEDAALPVKVTIPEFVTLDDVVVSKHNLKI